MEQTPELQKFIRAMRKRFNPQNIHRKASNEPVPGFSRMAGPQFTGMGSDGQFQKNKVVGPVHEGEMVIPAADVRNAGGPAALKNSVDRMAGQTKPAAFERGMPKAPDPTITDPMKTTGFAEGNVPEIDPDNPTGNDSTAAGLNTNPTGNKDLLNQTGDSGALDNINIDSSEAQTGFKDLQTDAISGIKDIAAGKSEVSQAIADQSRQAQAGRSGAQLQQQAQSAAQQGLTGGELAASRARGQRAINLEATDLEGKLALDAMDRAEKALFKLEEIGMEGQKFEEMKTQFKANWEARKAEYKENVRKFDTGTALTLTQINTENGRFVANAQLASGDIEGYAQTMKDTYGIDVDTNYLIDAQNEEKLFNASANFDLYVEEGDGRAIFGEDGEYIDDPTNTRVINESLKMYNLSHEGPDVDKDDPQFKKYLEDSYALAVAKKDPAYAAAINMPVEAKEGFITGIQDDSGNQLYSKSEDGRYLDANGNEFEYRGQTGVKGMELALVDQTYGVGAISKDINGNFVFDENSALGKIFANTGKSQEPGSTAAMEDFTKKVQAGTVTSEDITSTFKSTPSAGISKADADEKLKSSDTAYMNIDGNAVKLVETFTFGRERYGIKEAVKVEYPVGSGKHLYRITNTKDNTSIWSLRDPNSIAGDYTKWETEEPFSERPTAKKR